MKGQNSSVSFFQRRTIFFNIFKKINGGKHFEMEGVFEKVHERRGEMCDLLSLIYMAKGRMIDVRGIW